MQEATKKRRYFIDLAYNGKDFHGWQIQPNAVTVQQVLNEKLSMLLRSECYCVGCGRTDTGVHASCFMVHFDTDAVFDYEALCYKLNQVLPRSVAVYKIYPVHYQAHSRFSALSRSYKYTIMSRKNPFLWDTAWLYQNELDIEKMNEAALILFRYEDFTSFSKLHTDTKTNNCSIYEAEWQRKGDSLVFSISADRFLRNMVRAVVGTLLEVGRGKMTLEEFEDVIKAKDRSSAGFSVPAQGLSLVNVSYPEWIYELIDGEL